MSGGVFTGLSTLRQKDEESKPKLPTERAKQLQQYFAERYGPINNDQKVDENKKRKRKKKKVEENGGLVSVSMGAGAVRIVDEDISGFRNVDSLNPYGSTYDRDDRDDDGDQPIVANAEEAEVLKKQIEREKELLSKRGEAGGWRVVQHIRHHSPPEQQDASPPRRGRHERHAIAEDQDASPPRRGRHEMHAIAEDQDASPPRRRMQDGSATGMISGKDLMEDMVRKREQEVRHFSRLNDEVTGRGAETVYRSTSGQRVTHSEYVQLQDALKRSKKAKYDEEAALPWGGGLKQREEREEQRRLEREEAARPFSRGYDERLDLEKRGMVRWGDPMAGLVRRDLADGQGAQSTALAPKNVDSMKKSGFIIPMEVPAHSWLRRGASAPPNRYNIKPGRHWDGVDRSTGFERDYFKTQIEKQRQEQDAFMWAQGEM